ncbi:hypothetical protein ACFQQG_04615 [Halovenus salina]|uniref:RNA-binding protein n=1 Tax=Halovenus salina TaxID=1510225 RepID=A0ABD5W0A5_9EURY
MHPVECRRNVGNQHLQELNILLSETVLVEQCDDDERALGVVGHVERDSVRAIVADRGCLFLVVGPLYQVS